MGTGLASSRLLHRIWSLFRQKELDHQIFLFSHGFTLCLEAFLYSAFKIKLKLGIISKYQDYLLWGWLAKPTSVFYELFFDTEESNLYLYYQIYLKTLSLLLLSFPLVLIIGFLTPDDFSSAISLTGVWRFFLIRLKNQCSYWLLLKLILQKHFRHSHDQIGFFFGLIYRLYYREG